MQLKAVMKSKKVLMVASVVIASSMAYKFFHQGSAAEMPTVVVKASMVQEADLPQEIHAIGTLTARSVQITPEIAGHVNSVLFEDGAYVKRGTVLVQLDDSVYRTQADSARARLQYAENKYNRMALLGKKGVIAQQTIDEVNSDLKQTRADVKEKEVMLGKMQLIAPFDGVVGRSLVNPGDYVNVGQKLVVLTDTKHLRIEYTVPEKYLPHLKVGQPVTVTATAYPGKVFTGTLSFISPTINADNRSIAVYADIDNSEGLLAAGMYVDAAQSLGVTSHALIVPARSLMPVLDGAQVFKVVEGKAYSVNVVIGQRTPDTVQITQGLTKEDVVITDGQMKVKNGMPVKIQS